MAAEYFTVFTIKLNFKNRHLKSLKSATLSDIIFYIIHKVKV